MKGTYDSIRPKFVGPISPRWSRLHCGSWSDRCAGAGHRRGNILAGTYRQRRIIPNTLRFLSNRLRISLVCVGVNEARETTSGDVQLARRFEQVTLSRWAANGKRLADSA
nr:TniB family NTP-binding protein [Sinorhizobium meliloti]